jgi:hypothetical protein
MIQNIPWFPAGYAIVYILILQSQAFLFLQQIQTLSPCEELGSYLSRVTAA